MIVIKRSFGIIFLFFFFFLIFGMVLIVFRIFCRSVGNFFGRGFVEEFGCLIWFVFVHERFDWFVFWVQG